MKRTKSVGKSTARGRGTYVGQACNFCRMRKTKCNGTKPICGPCDLSGHECTWGSESAKRPSTKSYVESLKNRIEALETYVRVLEDKVQIKCKHGCASDCDEEGHAWSPGTTSLREAAYRPVEDRDLSDSDDAENLISSATKQLVIEDNDLHLYGPTSVFRLAPKAADRIARFAGFDETDKYDLMVAGPDASKHFYNPEFEWSRFLPREIQITRQEHDHLLDLTFKFFTSWCMRVVPALFLRDMYRVLCVDTEGDPPKAPHYSPMLHNALLAIATAFSDEPMLQNSRQHFANHAKSFIEVECRTPNISVVHALSMLASFHSSQGEQTLGYLYFGMSGRMSQALGLDVDCSPWVKRGLITDEDMFDRNWANWTIFSQDVCWSLYVGRDFCVSAPSDQRRIPVPFVCSEYDQILWHYMPSGLQPQPGYLSQTFAETCELMKIARRIMHVVNGLTTPGTRPETTHELVSKIDVDLNAWKERLPPEVDITPSTRATALPHRLMLHLAYWWLLILPHRPFYRKARSAHGADKDIDHVKLCNRAAENIMELLGTWRSLYTLRYVPVTLFQTVFSAGTVFILGAVQATSGARLAPVSLQHALGQAEMCIQYLREAGRSFQAANNIANILELLLKEQMKPRLHPRPVESTNDTTTNRMSECVKIEDSSSEGGFEDYPSPYQNGALRLPASIQCIASRGSDWLSGPNRDDEIKAELTEDHWGQTNPFGVSNYVDNNPAMDDLFVSGSAPFSLGMPGGETFPQQPFMPFGMPRPVGASGDFYQQQMSSYSPPRFDLTEEDFVTLQSIMNPVR